MPVSVMEVRGQLVEINAFPPCGPGDETQAVRLGVELLYSPPNSS